MTSPASSPRFRPARIRRLFDRFALEHQRLAARLDRAADEIAREVLENRAPLPLAVLEARARFKLAPSDRRVVVYPDGLVRHRIVEALVVAGRPRDAAKVAAGVIPAYPGKIPGGSIFLLDPHQAEWILDGRSIPLPARSRIDLGPL